MKAVFDTNIFISAFAIPGGQAEAAYLGAVRGSFDLVTSISILTETADVLKRKFEWSDSRTKQLLKVVSKVATVLKTRSHIHILKDEPDNRVLECALMASADFIVTGDHHLLSLKEYKGISIIKLSRFLELL